MEKPPMGLIIRTIIQQKNLSPTRLAQELGITKQQVYNTYVRSNFHAGEIEKWAKVLKVSTKELTDFNFESNKSVENVSSDDVMSLIRKMFEDELREKNEQIKALQEALRESQQMSRVLLGKSRECLDRDVLPMYPNGISLPAETA